jgi:malto-oligosyltrehalose trehalohydrolase
VAVRIGIREHALEAKGGGWWQGLVKDARPGDDYWVVLDGETRRPDPRSRFQPQGVHGPSRLVDPSGYAWQDQGWRGIAKGDLVIYEIHVGTFSPEGTYEGALRRLDHLLDLGATAVELMPLAQAPGRWNWGYDGVNLFAPNHHYGSPDDLRRFVDVCHQRGLAVILDVVYNHFGPEGNYLWDFGPYFSRRHHTPWGPALNFDGASNLPVRQFVVENAVFWLEEYHLDGLRLDAIRLMQDDSEHHVTEEIARAVHRWAADQTRPIHLIAEANVHDPVLLDPVKGEGTYDLLWNDEIPHSLFSAVLGQHRIDARTYRGMEDLGQALDTGYVFERQRTGTDILRSGEPERCDLGSMMQGLQTHDQVGNHPEGRRLHQVASPTLQRAGAAMVLLHPAVPMCFMGEEFAAPSPFCFFVDFGDSHLRKAVVEGRKRDYHQHDWANFVSPVEEATFLRSKLCRLEAGDLGMWNWYRSLLALRKRWRASGLLDSGALSVEAKPEIGWFRLSYAGGAAQVVVNLGSEPVDFPGRDGVRLYSGWRRFGGEERDEQIPVSLPGVSAVVISQVAD